MMFEIITIVDTTESVCFQRVFIFIMTKWQVPRFWKQYLELILYQSINRSINQSRGGKMRDPGN